ncbi:MAG: hypothetical protein ACP5Q3_00130 [bacterium]
MKNNFYLFFLGASCLLLMGMGELGGTAPLEKIPIPPKDFKVEISDQMGVKTNLSKFSQEGKVVLAGKRGQAQVAIPFEIISKIEFVKLEGQEVILKVSLREAKSYEIKIEKKSKFFGQADFGPLRIEAQDIKTINFLP